MTLINHRQVIAALLYAISLAARSGQIELAVDAAKPQGAIDLTCYGLGQGGLSEKPMFAAHLQDLAQLRPQAIRFFVQEFFNLYPEHHRFHWESLDRFIESILATGAKPIPCLCFKPKALFPKTDQWVVHPNDYEEWEQLIAALVRHCNQEKKFGITYWEISNEPDIGEDGGCPFRFNEQDYLVFYQHTAAAIRRADPQAQVGGPALAWHGSNIGDALIDSCATNKVPLDFFSWHVYNSDPSHFRATIRAVKAKLAKYPQLNNCELHIDEWNMALETPNLDPAFQPAFILETTRAFYEEGLSRSAYYHIRDWYVDPAKFKPFMSKQGLALMARWWNEVPQYDGLWDSHGQIRPAYFAFKLLSQVRGRKLAVTGTTADIHAFAAKTAEAMNVLLWNFPADAQPSTNAVVVRFPGIKDGRFREIALMPHRLVNQLEVRRTGEMGELEKEPLRVQLAPHDIRQIMVLP